MGIGIKSMIVIIAPHTVVIDRLPEDHGTVATAQGTIRRSWNGSETGTIDIVIIDGIEAGARTNEVGATINMTVRSEVGVLAEMITANVEGLYAKYIHERKSC
jgi:hypothetical protein